VFAPFLYLIIADSSDCAVFHCSMISFIGVQMRVVRNVEKCRGTFRLPLGLGHLSSAALITLSPHHALAPSISGWISCSSYCAHGPCWLLFRYGTLYRAWPAVTFAIDNEVDMHSFG